MFDSIHKKRIEAEANGGIDGKALYKLMNNTVYGKAMENVRNGIYEELVSNKKDHSKWTSKPSYMSQKIFDNNLVEIRENNVTLTLNQPAYIEMCILGLSKVSTTSTRITLKIYLATTYDYYLQILII